jgi:DNA-binding transcriptional regulator PaaX
MNQIPTLPEIMTPSAVMSMLDVCRATLTRMQSRGDFPYYKFGKRVYYRRSEILTSLTAKRVQIASTESTQAA